ncbi:unnamed protein product [Cyprideis torosa]|uniref:Uncharacterized protein n=1 Tax=Cyprideis torosa TaxID=163714 RepID=A0A7R8WQZ8_9CRUS|nr:unnamed protein product [Cyprideis torosa]CAG0903571.1 unnamed protein product [Cyprideis torosa]
MNSMCLGFLVALTVVATIDGALDLSSNAGPWIGGVEVGSSGEFVWRSTNASILGDNWADNEPNSPTSGDAIAMDCENEFKWRDLERTTDLPFMCEADANPPPVTWGCPEGFQMVGRGCYHFGTEQLNFDNSRTYCHGLGGKLLEFETADEMFTFNDYFTENPPSSCSGHWIGGEERGNSQQFQWISSARPVLFYNWLDYPNSDSDQGLALECPRSPKWKWNDFPKSRTYNPICETDLIEI